MSALNKVSVPTNGDETKEVTILSEATYNFLKKCVQVLLPATASLYFGIAQILDLPGGEEVVGIIALLTTFFGVVLSISSGRYNDSDAAVDGDAIVEADPGGLTGVTLELNKDPEILTDQETITFKVRRVPA